MPPNSYHDFARITGKATDPVQVVEDFEDGIVVGSGEEYQTNEGGIWATHTSPVHEGTYSLGSTGDAVAPTTYLWSSSGLDRYPQRGDTFSIRTYIGNASGSSADERPQFHFGWQDEGTNSDGDPQGDRYTVRWYGPNNDSGPTNQFSLNSLSTAVDMPTEEWLETVVDWQTGGDIVATLYDSSGTQLAQLTDTDSTYDTGGIIFQAGQNPDHHAYFDIVKIL